jgi:DNA-binding response OmpR family regulator
MMLPLVLVHERERRLAEALRAPAAEARWVLREPRRQEQILRLLRRRGPGLFIVQIGAAPEKDLALMQRVREVSPETGIIAILDREIPQLAGLTWNLGAHMVFFAPVVSPALIETASTLLRSLHSRAGASIPLAEPDVERHP